MKSVFDAPSQVFVDAGDGAGDGDGDGVGQEVEAALAEIWPSVSVEPWSSASPQLNAPVVSSLDTLEAGGAPRFVVVVGPQERADAARRMGHGEIYGYLDRERKQSWPALLLAGWEAYQREQGFAGVGVAIADVERQALIASACGRIAHDLGNILSVISLHASMLEEEEFEDEEVREDVTAVMASARQANVLVEQLRTGFRLMASGDAPCDLGATLVDGERMVRCLAGKSVEFNCASEGSGLAVAADRAAVARLLGELGMLAQQCGAGSLSLTAKRRSPRQVVLSAVYDGQEAHDQLPALMTIQRRAAQLPAATDICFDEVSWNIQICFSQ